MLFRYFTLRVIVLPLVQMASSDAKKNVKYFVPGGYSVLDFSSMCDWYMNTYFPRWKDSGVNLVPPLPEHMPLEPPEAASGGARRKSTGKKQYFNFRTGQKSQIDEYNVVKLIQKYATENDLAMFIFHGLKMDQQRWKLMQFVIRNELTADVWDDLKVSCDFDEKLNLPCNLEIDLVTLDPQNGLILWEVKSRDFGVEGSANLNKIGSAVKQLKKDKLFITWLAKWFTSLHELELEVKQVVVLPDDTITSEQNDNFGNLRQDYNILDKENLADMRKFFEKVRTDYPSAANVKSGVYTFFSLASASDL